MRKTITQYWVESRDRRDKFFPIGTDLKKARMLAQLAAEDFEEIVFLMRRKGACKAEFAPGCAYFEPERFCRMREGD